MSLLSFHLYWQKIRYFWMVCIFSLLTISLLLLWAHWLPTSFNKLQHVIINCSTTLAIIRWILIGMLWYYWSVIITQIGKRYQWEPAKISYWQYVRHRFIVWLILFECLVSENFLLRVWQHL